MVKNRHKTPSQMAAAAARVPVTRSEYVPPTEQFRADAYDLVARRGHSVLENDEAPSLIPSQPSDTAIYYAGRLELLDRKCVAIVGAREATAEGKSRAYKLAKALAAYNIVTVSGLAKGIDTAAHQGAIENGGNTVAIIGTPLTRAYPAENAQLQEHIYSAHLLMSPFSPAERTYRSSFPKRNRVMAQLSDATVIVEASDTSGTLHQAAECLAQNRWLFILKSVVDNPALTWPSRFLNHSRTIVASSPEDVITRIR